MSRGLVRLLLQELQGAPENFEASLLDYASKLPLDKTKIQFCARACNSDNACATAWSPAITWDADPPRLVQLWMWDPVEGIYTQPLCHLPPRDMWTKNNVLHSSCKEMFTNSSSSLSFQFKAADYPAESGSEMSGIRWAVLPRKMGETEVSEITRPCICKPARME